MFNTLTYNPVPNKPEVLDAYEIGLKTTLFDRRLRFNAAAFYYDLSNPQVQLTQGTSVLFSNADASEVKGVEFDAEALVATGLTLRASGAYMKSNIPAMGRSIR